MNLFRNSTGKSFIMDTGGDGADIGATFINGTGN